MPDTKDFKEFVWQKIAKRFSEFKYNMDKDYIFGGSKMGEDPCIAYPNIELDKWKEFVKYQKSEAFKVYLLYMYSSLLGFNLCTCIINILLLWYIGDKQKTSRDSGSKSV